MPARPSCEAKVASFRRNLAAWLLARWSLLMTVPIGIAKASEISRYFIPSTPQYQRTSLSSTLIESNAACNRVPAIDRSISLASAGLNASRASTATRV